MNNVVTTLAPSFLTGSSSFLEATRKTHNISNGFKNSARLDQGLMSYLRVWKIPHRLIMGEML